MPNSRKQQFQTGQGEDYKNLFTGDEWKTMKLPRAFLLELACPVQEAQEAAEQIRADTNPDERDYSG